MWLTCKLAGAFPQILLVISAGPIETMAKCDEQIVVLCCVVRNSLKSFKALFDKNH